MLSNIGQILYWATPLPSAIWNWGARDLLRDQPAIPKSARTVISVVQGPPAARLLRLQLRNVNLPNFGNPAPPPQITVLRGNSPYSTLEF